MREDYRKTVELLLDIAPRVFSEPTFAMKGGTAINLFVRDFPRLDKNPKKHAEQLQMLKQKLAL